MNNLPGKKRMLVTSVIICFILSSVFVGQGIDVQEGHFHELHVYLLDSHTNFLHGMRMLFL